MKTQTKLVLGVALLAVAGMAVNSASAGNLPVTGVEYFSVDVPAGNQIQYVGPNQSTVTMLIDDITYSGLIDPCFAPDKCEYFPRGVMASYYTPEEGGTNPNATNMPPFVVYTYSEARGTDHVLSLIEANSAGLFQEFDRMSHSTHAELYAVSTYASGPNTSTQSSGSVDLVTGHITVTSTTVNDPSSLDPDNLLDWDLMGVAMTSWATPTSQSRHYQTPQIVQPGNWVEVRLLIGNSYGNASAKIKGRLVVDASETPVEALSTINITATP